MLDRADLRMVRVTLNYYISALELCRRSVPPAAYRLAANLEHAMSADGPDDVVPQPEWFTTAQVAQRMGCTQRHARRIAQRIGRRVGRQWMIPVDALPVTED